jgi:cysteine-rich repeat protein
MILVFTIEAQAAGNSESVASPAEKAERWIDIGNDLLSRDGEQTARIAGACAAMEYFERAHQVSARPIDLELFNAAYFAHRYKTALLLGRHVEKASVLDADQFAEYMEWLVSHADTLEDRECPNREPQCGDFLVEGTESCDDGNQQDGDGCSSSCQTEPRAPPEDAEVRATSVVPSGASTTADERRAAENEGNLLHEEPAPAQQTHAKALAGLNRTFDGVNSTFNVVTIALLIGPVSLMLLGLPVVIGYLIATQVDDAQQKQVLGYYGLGIAAGFVGGGILALAANGVGWVVLGFIDAERADAGAAPRRGPCIMTTTCTSDSGGQGKPPSK